MPTENSTPLTDEKPWANLDLIVAHVLQMVPEASEKEDALRAVILMDDHLWGGDEDVHWTVKDSRERRRKAVEDRGFECEAILCATLVHILKLAHPETDEDASPFEADYGPPPRDVLAEIYQFVSMASQKDLVLYGLYHAMRESLLRYADDVPMAPFGNFDDRDISDEDIFDAYVGRTPLRELLS